MLHMCSWLSAFQSVHQSLPTPFPFPKTGGELVSAEHYRSEEVRGIVQTLSQSWKELSSASNEKGQCQLYTIFVLKFKT